MFNKLFFICLVLTSHTVFALPEQVGTISFLQIHKSPNESDPTSPRFIVNLAGDGVVESSCGSNSWASPLKTEADRTMFSTLLALQIAEKKVKLQGTNANKCLSGALLIRNVYSTW